MINVARSFCSRKPLTCQTVVFFSPLVPIAVRPRNCRKEFSPRKACSRRLARWKTSLTRSNRTAPVAMGREGDVTYWNSCNTTTYERVDANSLPILGPFSWTSKTLYCSSVGHVIPGICQPRLKSNFIVSQKRLTHDLWYDNYAWNPS